jgi:hypothetical protein
MEDNIIKEEGKKINNFFIKINKFRKKQRENKYFLKILNLEKIKYD